MKNSAKELHDYAVSQGHAVAVRCASEGDILQQPTTSWKKIKDGIESTGYVSMVILERDTTGEKTKYNQVAWALIIDHEDVEEWLSDYGVNEFMEAFEKQRT